MSVDICIYKFEPLLGAELEKVKWFDISDDEKALAENHDWNEFNYAVSLEG